MQANVPSDALLARELTRAASRQTDMTIHWLVDKDMRADAYRTYGYFRWVDDWLDQDDRPRQERLAFVSRQKDLMERGYAGEPTRGLAPEEQHRQRQVVAVKISCSEPF